MSSTAPGAGVWINGHVSSADQAMLAYDDHGITVGDGVFETIKVDAGQPFALTRHLVRLDASVAALRLEPIDRQLLLDAVAAVTPGVTGFLRLTVTAGRGPLGSPRDAVAPTVIAATRSGAARLDPTGVVIVPWTRNERGALAGVKSTSYAENVIALDVAIQRGASEALFGNTRDELCEGTGSNVFVALDGVLVTPPLSSGCLAGVTRALLLEAMPEVAEAPIPMARLADITEAFLVSTAREVQPVARIDDRPLPAPGPLTAHARAVWSERFSHAADW